MMRTCKLSRLFIPAVLVTTLWLSVSWLQVTQPAQANAASPPADNQKVTAVSADDDDFTRALVGDLTAKGFQVTRGYPELYTIDDCITNTYPTYKNCFLGNPAAPYVVPVVKSWPDEYVDPATVNGLLETDPGYLANYRLDPREAIVVYGLMPPPGRYLGLQTWEFSAHGNWKAKDYDQWANTPDISFPMQFLFDTIPPADPKSQRVLSVSALGDVVNNVVMERQSGYPFGETRYFIITPSAATDHAVRLALQAQGVLDSHIFTEQIPSQDAYGPIGPLGMGKNAIDFFTAFRYAVPDDQRAAENWRNTLPLTVLRLRPPENLGPVQRYGSLVFVPRTANSEAELAGDLENLVTAVCDTLGKANFTSTDCTLPPPATSFIPELVRDFGWTGPYCRSVGMDCEGDQQEAGLYFSSPRPLDSGQVLAVIDTLATETGNATYVGLSANDASMMAGVSNVLDTDLTTPDGVIKGLKGSADSFAGTVNNTGKFFVHYFAKDCDVLKDVPGGKDNCSPTKGVEPALGDPALQGTFIIALRDYVAPHTQSGPDPSKLLTPRILTFRPQ